MKSNKIAVRYARALLEFALERNREGVLYEEMKTLAASFSGELELQQVIENPTILREDKQKLIRIAGGINVSDAFDAFLRLIFGNKREVDAVAIAEQYQRIYRRHKGMITAKLTSARPLPPDRIDELKKTIVGTSGKSVDFIEITDASLIGGFVLDIDFERLDAAVSNQLRRMKKQLMAKD